MNKKLTIIFTLFFAAILWVFPREAKAKHHDNYNYSTPVSTTGNITIDSHITTLNNDKAKFIRDTTNLKTQNTDLSHDLAVVKQDTGTIAHDALVVNTLKKDVKIDPLIQPLLVQATTTLNAAKTQLSQDNIAVQAERNVIKTDISGIYADKSIIRQDYVPIKTAVISVAEGNDITTLNNDKTKFIQDITNLKTQNTDLSHDLAVVKQDTGTIAHDALVVNTLKKDVKIDPLIQPLLVQATTTLNAAKTQLSQDNIAVQAERNVIKTDIGVDNQDYKTIRQDNTEISKDLTRNNIISVVAGNDITTLNNDKAKFIQDITNLKTQNTDLSHDLAVVKQDTGTIAHDALVVNTLKKDVKIDPLIQPLLVQATTTLNAAKTQLSQDNIAVQAERNVIKTDIGVDNQDYKTIRQDNTEISKDLTDKRLQSIFNK